VEYFIRNIKVKSPISSQSLHFSQLLQIPESDLYEIILPEKITLNKLFLNSSTLTNLSRIYENRISRKKLRSNDIKIDEKILFY
jgi:hypothetical protein